MKLLCFVVTLTAAFTLGGCAESSAISDSLFVTPKTPNQVVFRAEGDYLAAKILAAKDMAEPACGTTAAPPAPLCSSPSTVTTIGTTEANVEQALVAAENVVGSFISIVHSTEVK